MAGSPYTILCHDLVTNRALGSYPFTGISYQTTLNGAGSASFSLPLADPKIAASNWDFNTVEARTAVYILRNDIPVWGGIIWTRDYDSTTQSMHFQAATFESYLMHIPYTATTTWTNVDQNQIVRDVITAISGIGYVLPLPVSTNNSGILRTFTVIGDERKWVSDIIGNLQQLPNGFDFNVDVYFTPGTGPYKQLNLSYPLRGVRNAATRYVFEYPGNVMRYRWSEDGSAFATNVIEMGAGSGPTMAVGSAAAPDQLTNGWPIMFQIISRKDVQDTAFLTSYAAGDLLMLREPSLLVEFHLRADRDPFPGTYSVGDSVRVRIVDPRFPKGADGGYLRIQSIKVSVSDDGPEDVAVVCIRTAS